MNNTRDLRIDLLRFLGLALIVLAHVQPPLWLANLRNFDVPLMVLVSGMSFALSYKEDAYASYVWKRLKRLLFPVWLFLSLYFLYRAVLGSHAASFDLSLIIPSYLLRQNGSIGYVWIIRVFLLVALLAPFVWRWHRRVLSDFQFLLQLAGLFLVYEVLRYLAMPWAFSSWTGYVADIILYAIPYTLLFALGLRFLSMSGKARISMFAIGLFGFLGLGLLFYVQQGHYVNTQRFKYPASFYYFSYAIWMCCVLWWASRALLSMIKRLRLEPMVLFVSSNSIWIYLWHIVCLSLPILEFSTGLRWLIVFLCATTLAYIQVSAVKFALGFSENKRLNMNIKALLTG